jgi:hypothetical protein
VITGIAVPLEVAIVLCAGFGAVGAWAGRRQTIRRLDPRRLRVEALPLPAATGAAIDLAAHRDAVRGGSQAVLQGRIDPITGQDSRWSQDTRDHVAAIMRASLRRGDSLAQAECGSFTIAITGADERAATRIADRLRRALGQLRLPQHEGDPPLTASFGVAAERHGETGDALARRARQALEAALAQGRDHVIAASEIEEVILLPAPEAPPAASAA